MLREDIERELQNWALWRGSGGWFAVWSSCDISDAYEPEAARYRQATVPVLSGAAVDVDDIITALARDLREALYAQYLGQDAGGWRIPPSFTQAQIARVLGISARKYERLLAAARKSVGFALSELRRKTFSARPKIEA